jgi:hypothetical protein
MQSPSVQLSARTTERLRAINNSLSVTETSTMTVSKQDYITLEPTGQKMPIGRFSAAIE